MDLPHRFIHQATRYVIGRKTGAVGEHCDWLVANWKRLPAAERRTIQRDLEEAFGRDDRARQMGSKDLLWLGDDCDRRNWERVRALYTAPSVQPTFAIAESLTAFPFRFRGPDSSCPPFPSLPVRESTISVGRGGSWQQAVRAIQCFQHERRSAA